jgi:predicted dithiol-disulfide oxidoreductase (DUF899 family)
VNIAPEGIVVTTIGLPPVVDEQVWQRELEALRAREKTATRELDAIAAQRRRLPMVAMPDYVLEGEHGTVNSPFGADVGAPPGGGFGVNVFLRDGKQVYRTWHTNGRGTEQLSHSFALIDLLPYGRQEEWQDSPENWPQSPTYSRWAGPQDIARAYGVNQSGGAG